MAIRMRRTLRRTFGAPIAALLKARYNRTFCRRNVNLSRVSRPGRQYFAVLPDATRVRDVDSMARRSGRAAVCFAGCATCGAGRRGGHGRISELERARDARMDQPRALRSAGRPERLPERQLHGEILFHGATAARLERARSEERRVGKECR